MNTRNSTITALVVANTVDQILREYREALDIGFDMTNMSNMMMTKMPTLPSSPSLSQSSYSDKNASLSANSTVRYNDNDDSQVVNLANYQSEKASQIYTNKLLALGLSSNGTDAAIITQLEKNIANLNSLVNRNVPALEVMMLVHGQIHSSLQSMYGLKLKQ